MPKKKKWWMGRQGFHSSILITFHSLEQCFFILETSFKLPSFE